MWQELQGLQLLQNPSTHPPRRTSVQMPVLQQGVLRRQLLQEAHTPTHRREALHVYRVWQTVPSERLPEAPLLLAHRRATF